MTARETVVFDTPALPTKSVLITGAASGIGAACCEQRTYETEFGVLLGGDEIDAFSNSLPT